ncbi:MAG: hypothetical protein E7588_10180 [Ruminococcaceae bacterium]|nr:hypothetical protein [Oscillospiraceae bacterium]
MNKPNTNNIRCRSITERYCYEVGENVVLRSTSPDNESYECLYSPFCKSRDKCIRKNTKKTENRDNV